MLKLASVFGKKNRGKRWKFDPADLPWFDQPDAHARLDRRAREQKLDDETVAMLRQWIDDGYLVARDLVEMRHIDGMLADLDAIWTAERPTPGLEVLGARLKDEDPMVRPHAELLKLPLAERERLRDNAPWRIHGFYRFSESAAAIYNNQRLLELNTLLFGRPAVKDSTINFMYGSRQALHQDLTVFLLHPMNYLNGAWLACEDIHADSGPLVVYPGSHKEPMYREFDNYPQTSLKTCSPETKARYEEHLNATAKKYKREQFLGKKGDLLLWHAMLIHGGDAVKNPKLTRKSYVCHYMAEGVNRADEVAGPFNW